MSNVNAYEIDLLNCTTSELKNNLDEIRKKRLEDKTTLVTIGENAALMQIIISEINSRSATKISKAAFGISLVSILLTILSVILG